MASSRSLSASLKKKAKRQKWLPLLLRFLEELRIQSKEVPSIDDERGGSLLELWDSQKMFLETLCDGLEEGVHEFYYLKSRQLGITTLGLAIILFWLAVNPRMIGCIVADTDANSMGFREQLNTIMRSFPEDFVGDDFTVAGNNKNFMTFSNGSRLDFLVAGKNKENWAESKGYALAWASEISKYGKQEGIDSFRETLSQTHPNRLFIFESTANGFANAWHDMWLAAGDDPFTKRRRFIGWWAKPANIISRKDPRFDVYGRLPPNGEEAEKITKVAEQYGHVVTLEQLAWYRWRQADKSQAEGTLEQNQPYTEQDAFTQPGFSFFQMRLVQRVYDSILENPPIFTGYRFILGTDIFATRMEQITDQAQLDLVDLRIWEEPTREGIYVIGCDPAYGRTEWADKHSINIFRAYADKLVQVAEYSTAEVETHHCAWVLAYLAGAYRNCVVNLELGGPGRAILREFDQLRDRMKAEVYAARVRDLEWDDFLDQARWYLYHRPDSPGPGFAFAFECLALDTPLPTPSGWTTMGRVREGDYLISDTGKPTKVIGLSDIKQNAKCYELTFDDSTIIVADENHWWKVAGGNWKDGDRLRKTSQLVPGKHKIRKAEALDLPDIDLPVDPYLLGVWLGDGSSNEAVVSCGDQDVEEMVSHIEACGQPTRRTRHRTCWQVRLTDGNNGSRGNPFLRALRKLGVLGNKHIPAMYLRASRNQRLSLLQGLMDTDGSACCPATAGKCNFVNTNKALVDGFSELIRSLGFKAKFLTWDESIKKGVQCALRYQFWFTAYPETPVFRLRRKRERLIRRGGESYRKPCHRIVSITEVESVPVRCVMVDSPTSMFLVGDGMIPTHNTTWRSKMEIMNQMRDSFSTDIFELRSLGLLDEMATMVQTRTDIAPSGQGRKKDDSVFSTALANRAWIDQLRNRLLQEGATYEVVTMSEAGELNVTQQMIKRMVYDFFRTANERAEMPHEPTFLEDRGLG